MSPNCDGLGKLPCTCWASSCSAPVPCTCLPCDGCDACRRVKAEEAERERRKYASDLAYCQSKWGTAPPPEKKGRAAAKGSDQGKLFN